MSIFTPLNTAFLGFDRLFNDLDQHLASTTGVGYPPLNLYKDDQGYRIELAIAGFKRENVNIEHDRVKGVLTVTGKNANAEPAEQLVVKRGIANRGFARAFTISDDLEVTDAVLEDGMLTIDLKKTVREQHKPLLIPIK